jgi:hypothetical protein
MYRPTRHAILLSDPGITVTLSNDEEIKLMPMDPQDRPNKHKSMNRFVELLGQSPESSRWNNLPAFLVGMAMAKENLPEGWLEKLVRKANEQDRAGVIVRCMEMSKKTRMTLADAAPTRELMIGLHSRAVRAQFEKEALESALRQAEYVVLMMDKEEHCGGKLKDGQKDMRQNLTVLGVLLEIAAARSVRFSGAVDTDGKVARYAEKTLAICKDDTFDVSEETLVMEGQLLSWLPLWSGMRLAMKMEEVAQSSTGQSMQKALGELEHSVSRIREAIQQKVQKDQGKQKRCLAMYQELQEGWGIFVQN